MRQMLIANVGLLRRIVRIFEGRVMHALNDGWRIVPGNLSVEKKGLRIVCVALLEKPEKEPSKR